MTAHRKDDYLAASADWEVRSTVEVLGHNIDSNVSKAAAN